MDFGTIIAHETAFRYRTPQDLSRPV